METLSELSVRASDIILTASIALFCVVLLLLPLISPMGETVVITVDGTVFASLPLFADSETDVDGLLRVIIKDGNAHVEDSICPNGQCERSAAISKAGSTIICLPNKIIVKIVGESEVDAISG